MSGSQRFLSGLAIGSISAVALSIAIVKVNQTQNTSPVVVTVGNQPSPYQSRFQEIMGFGLPPENRVSIFENHALHYSNEKRTPRWVAEHLTKTNLLKVEGVNRKHSSFAADRDILEQFRPAPDEYYKTGWSRGHMAPAADCRSSQSAMNQTFLLSNIVPQDRDNNEKYWANLESFCRGLTDFFDDVYVLSGPLYLPQRRPDGSRYVQYEIIGKSDIAVPTHLFKVILAVRSGQQPVLGAFIVPNSPIPATTPLPKFQVPLQEVERVAGQVFLPELDRSKVKDL
ncbi:nuclease EXOG, mitochondrial-like [Sycon ciliatum]|uniref:nuclease EXOG, mitochondrial-like n=1 Tax=Sycon ciliatum TaxID=27933 RepID=UPI0031F67D19